MEISPMFLCLLHRPDTVTDNIMERGEAVYEQRKEELDQRYGGEVIAIDIEAEEIAGHGQTISEAAEAVETEEEGRIYFKRVGKAYAATLL